MKVPPEIVRATPDLAPALTGIAFEAKRHWGYPESWIQSWSRLLTITPQYLMANETHRATKDERTVGFYSLKLEPGEIHLEHLWVLPEAMGQGTGRALFTHAVGQPLRSKPERCSWKGATGWELIGGE